jgi:prepilin-type N-terminal cleavage/methylation domain-containing protein
MSFPGFDRVDGFSQTKLSEALPIPYDDGVIGRNQEMRAGRSSCSSGAFTLTELLVVIAIIVLMAALGVGAFRGGAASDGTRGASYLASTVFDAARNEAIMRRVPTVVLFDVGTQTNLDTAYRRMTVAYSTNATPNYTTTNDWIQSGKWIKFPANAYFDAARSRGLPSTMSSVHFGLTTATACVVYGYLPNGQANYSGVTTQPLKVVFSPGMLSSGTFIERPDKKSLYGFVINKLGHTQQFADLNSLTNCP